MTTSSGPRPLLKPARPPGSRSWAAFALLGLGLVSTLLLLGVDALRERLLTEDFALVRAASEIETGLATSHLWMEQYVTGDNAVPQQEIWRGIERSLALVHAMLADGRLVEGPWQLRPSRDPALRRRAEALERDLQTYAESTLKRQAGYESGEKVGPGSGVDAEYDRIFKRLAAAAAGLRAAAEGRLAHRLGLFRLYSSAIVAGWLVIVVIAFFGFRRFEARRQRAEAVLRDRELQLVQAQKMEAVGRLAGGLAHDINNYLAAIRSQCELVQRKPQPPERVAEKMGLVIGSVHRASTLISRLLAFSRRQPIHPEVVNLNPLVTGLEKIVRQHLGERIAQSSHLAPDLWNVKMDPAQIEQIVVNLVVNARDAMPAGGKLVIETANTSFGEADRERRPVTTPGDYVLLSVSDTGVGIPAEIQDKIFEPFFTTKEGAGNSGLGLATIYGIVKQNGGNVWAESEAGKGTTFRVYLPASAEAAPRPAQETRTPVLALGGDERILLVEDNALVRESTLGLLESVGYEVTVAADGAQALGLVESAESAARPFDLLLTDVVMPGLSGPEVAERVRARQGAIPVVFVSGYSESVIHYHGLLQPGVHFLGKPFAADALFKKVREALDNPPAASSTS
ncbi:MAG: two-component system, cell cycle sensor histidine kinase and response regulator CckA [Acidobacteriota bacterium]|nr:two-component system, cell cycle sensor histidine kinase and response regulator CckA [Acidobacteriota bacterium]